MELVLVLMLVKTAQKQLERIFIGGDLTQVAPAMVARSFTFLARTPDAPPNRVFVATIVPKYQTMTAPTVSNDAPPVHGGRRHRVPNLRGQLGDNDNSHGDLRQGIKVSKSFHTMNEARIMRSKPGPEPVPGEQPRLTPKRNPSTLTKAMRDPKAPKGILIMTPAANAFLGGSFSLALRTI